MIQGFASRNSYIYPLLTVNQGTDFHITPPHHQKLAQKDGRVRHK